MPNQKTVHISIDQFTATASAVGGATSVVYDNQNDVDLSGGLVSYIKQKVTFTDDKQIELGNTTLRKREGMVVIIIYVRKGKGSLDRDVLYDKMVKCFRSQVIGGATFLDPKMMAQGDSENWNASGYKIPFYFYEP